MFLPKRPKYRSRIDTAGQALFIVLAFLYAPLSLFGILFPMSGAGLIGEEAPAIPLLAEIASYIGYSMPLASTVSLVLADALRKRKKDRTAFFVQAMALLLFFLLAILYAVAYTARPS